MKITRTQLENIIKEELALVKEEDSPFGERNYDHSLVSNVSKTIEWEISNAFNFVLDLLEDVNAHAEYKIVKKVLWDSLEDAGGDEAPDKLTPGVGGVPPADDPRRAKVTSMEERKQK